MLPEWLQKEERRKKIREKHEDDEGQQRQVEGWLEQTGTQTRTIPKWSEVFGGKERPQSF